MTNDRNLGHEAEETTDPADESLTVDDIKQMSQDQINSRWAEVAAVLDGREQSS